MRQCVDFCRLTFTRNHEASAACVLQILHQGTDPCLSRLGRRAAGGTGHSELRRNRTSERADVRRTEQQSMIRFRSRVARGALDRVEAIALRTIALDSTPCCVRTRVSQRTVAGHEEVGIERQDDVRLLDRILRVDVLAEREAAAGTDVVATKRLPLDPLRPWKPGQKLVDLRPEGRGSDRFAQDADATTLRSLLSLLGVQHLPNCQRE
jgi:hypothetical protein